MKKRKKEGLEEGRNVQFQLCVHFYLKEKEEEKTGGWGYISCI
jgi:hypothetical protein